MLERKGISSFGRSMKGRALILLAFAAAGMAASWPFRGGFGGGLLLSACEAALVGGMADWFAVVALFRHPLGQSWLPHTAIVPANRRNIINGIVDIVENEWLKVAVIEEKIESLSLADGLLSLADGKRGQNRLRIVIGGLVGDMVRSLDTDKVAAYLEKALRDTVIAPLTVSVMKTMELGAYEDEITDFILDEFAVLLDTQALREVLADYLRRTAGDYKRSGFWRRLTVDTGEQLKIIDYGAAAHVAVTRLQDLLGEMREPGNEYRARLQAVFFNLENHEHFRRLIGSWKDDALNRLDLTRSIAAFIGGVKRSAAGGIISQSRSSNQLLNHIMDMVNGQLKGLREDPARKDRLDRWLKTELIRLVEKYHGLIGDTVRENLEGLNVESFVSSVEDRVGDDLQWIRINGTVVGALVGVALYLVTHLR
ncbi:MAG: DUF445 domain-containing protein [Peptococcaceae bacterium]|nr:DUF445 domain-containing protein [Peptococcaceae bacterium]